jgi:hypothetical protein
LNFESERLLTDSPTASTDQAGEGISDFTANSPRRAITMQFYAVRRPSWRSRWVRTALRLSRQSDWCARSKTKHRNGWDPVRFTARRFRLPQSRVRWRIDPVSTDVNLGLLHMGDTLAYVYTLTSEGTTHGFERGYDAFLGDPFGVEVVSNNLASQSRLPTCLRRALPL